MHSIQKLEIIFIRRSNLLMQLLNINNDNSDRAYGYEVYSYLYHS